MAADGVSHDLPQGFSQDKGAFPNPYDKPYLPSDPRAPGLIGAETFHTPISLGKPDARAISILEQLIAGNTRTQDVAKNALPEDEVARLYDYVEDMKHTNTYPTQRDFTSKVIYRIMGKEAQDAFEAYCQAHPDMFVDPTAKTDMIAMHLFQTRIRDMLYAGNSTRGHVALRAIEQFGLKSAQEVVETKPA